MSKIALKIIILILVGNVYIFANCNQDSLESKKLLHDAGVKHDFTSIHAFLLTSCNKGCLDSCNLLGVLYNASVAGNIYYSQKNAYNTFLKICNRGSSKGCMNAAKLENIELEEKKYLLKRALRLGDKASYYQLGKMYKKNKEYNLAIKMYQKACESSIKEGCIALAKIYHDGIILPRSIDMANNYSQMAGYSNYDALKYIVK
jgi:TPR repeat protein